MTPHVAHTDRGPKNRWHPCYSSLKEWLDNEAPIAEEEIPTTRSAKARNRVRLMRVRKR